MELMGPLMIGHSSKLERVACPSQTVWRTLQPCLLADGVSQTKSDKLDGNLERFVRIIPTGLHPSRALVLASLQICVAIMIPVQITH